MWKILTSQIKEEIYYLLTSRRLFPDEPKGCRKSYRGTGELLNIDQHILNESKTRLKNPPMAWIDDKQAYDMFPQSWIINCFKMCWISDEVINFIEKTMKTRSGLDDERKDHIYQKDPSKGSAPKNYRPITCLSMMWKILTAQIEEKIYNLPTSHGLFSDEQKGCRKGSSGTAELLYIDQHILKESKTRRNNLAMA